MRLNARTLTPVTTPARGGVSFKPPQYRRRMPVPANQVAAALREHLPGVEGGRLHRLLYYIQGHHLAMFDQPAFTNPVRAAADGPHIAGLGPTIPHRAGAIPQATHTLTLIVAARYGRLTAGDLSRLACAETPWRGATPAAEISHQSMREWFAGPGRPDEPAHPLLAPDPQRSDRVREEVARLHRGEVTRRPDDLDRLLGEVRGRAGR